MISVCIPYPVAKQMERSIREVSGNTVTENSKYMVPTNLALQLFNLIELVPLHSPGSVSITRIILRAAYFEKIL